MSSRIALALLALCALLLSGSAAVAVRAGAQPVRAHQSAHKPLFDVGIEGGFTGAVMTASIYTDGQVVIHRSGAGRPATTVERRVPLSRSSARAAVQLARSNGALRIPRALQKQRFGADVPVLSFRIYTATGARRVEAEGSESNHVAGTGPFFPVWGLLYALAGYPSQLG